MLTLLSTQTRVAAELLQKGSAVTLQPVCSHSAVDFAVHSMVLPYSSQKQRLRLLLLPVQQYPNTECADWTGEWTLQQCCTVCSDPAAALQILHPYVPADHSDSS